MEEDAESVSTLSAVTAYSLIIIGSVGVVLNSFLLVFLLYNIMKQKIISQKIVYINLAVADLAFSLIACTIRGPGIFMEKMFENRPFCVITTYLVSYCSKVDLLVIVPITLSIYIVTVFGFERCTNWFMIGLCSISWLVPAAFLAGYTIKGHVTPNSFYIRFSNSSRRCDFTGTAHPSYLLSQQVLFFYLPTGICALLYLIIGYYLRKYCVQGVSRLTRRGCFVTGFYCLCWVPFVVSSYYREYVSDKVFVFTYLFYYFSVVVNPLTYTITSHFFLARVKTLTSCYSSSCYSSSSSYSTPVKEGNINPGGLVIKVGNSEIDTGDEVGSGEDMTSRVRRDTEGYDVTS